MKILFDEIPESGVTVTVADASWFPEEDWVRVGPVAGELFFSRRQQRILLDGSLRFTSRFECDRCLEPYEADEDLRFRIVFEYLAPNDPYWLTEEHECPEEEMDVMALSEPVIDIEAVLEQQVILAVPVKRLCSEACLGLCPTCGLNLNRAACPCQGLERQSPFQVLARLKVK
jgi:uncharacterized protein